MIKWLTLEQRLYQMIPKIGDETLDPRGERGRIVAFTNGAADVESLADGANIGMPDVAELRWSVVEHAWLYVNV